MKIAIVSQPIDSILPPRQTSVGACSYGLGTALAASCPVTIYGLKDNHADLEEHFTERNVTYRLFPSAPSDRALDRARRWRSKLAPSKTAASTSAWLFPQFGRQVAADLQRQAFDVIHVQNCSQYLPVIRSLNPRCRLVLHVHAEWFSQHLRCGLEERLRHADLITGVSDFVTGAIRRDLPPVRDRCETTYNGVDTAEFARERNDTPRSGRTKTILYSGAVSPHKGIHVLLDAFRRVIQQVPEAQLQIAGFHASYPLAEVFDQRDPLIRSIAPFYQRNYRDRVKSKLRMAPADYGTYLSELTAKCHPDLTDKVSFPGFITRSDLLDRYFAADVFVFPPVWNEGFGIPPVEAMAAGTPAVVTRSGALVETVIHNQTGLIVEKDNPVALAEAMIELLKNDEKRITMGRAARRHALQNFSWQRIADRTLERYRSLAGREHAAVRVH